VSERCVDARLVKLITGDVKYWIHLV